MYLMAGVESDMSSGDGAAGPLGDDTMDPREFEKKTQDELDDILNSALDELEDDEDFATAGTDSRTQGAGDVQGIKAMEEDDEKLAAKALESLMDDFSNPEIADSLEKAFRHLGGHVEGQEALKEGFQAAKAAEKEEAERIAQGGQNQTTEGERRDSSNRPGATPAAAGAAAAAAAGAGAGGGEYGFGEGGTEMDRTIFRTLEMLSKSGAGMEGQDTAAMEGGGEDIMQQMMGEFGKMGEKEDYNGVMDNIMEQLLSRELMYDPIKQICDKYPEWLATHRDSLPTADYQRYGQQYQSFQRVLAVYETEPDNFPRLMELMQDMQEHGQVPAEIIKELAPGLEFNAEGAPIMPNVGEGMIPNIPGFPAGDGQNCSIS